MVKITDLARVLPHTTVADNYDTDVSPTSVIV